MYKFITIYIKKLSEMSEYYKTIITNIISLQLKIKFDFCFINKLKYLI